MPPWRKQQPPQPSSRIAVRLLAVLPLSVLGGVAAVARHHAGLSGSECVDRGGGGGGGGARSSSSPSSSRKTIRPPPPPSSSSRNKKRRMTSPEEAPKTPSDEDAGLVEGKSPAEARQNQRRRRGENRGAAKGGRDRHRRDPNPLPSRKKSGQEERGRNAARDGARC
mmetsp:Transcript_21380/g.45693  ORF Transcript_21380/g.45693 Transcript_21380/m.45693 type:complete len:167 (-) Transcript_21380:223-723(-)